MTGLQKREATQLLELLLCSPRRMITSPEDCVPAFSIFDFDSSEGMIWRASVSAAEASSIRAVTALCWRTLTGGTDPCHRQRRLTESGMALGIFPGLQSCYPGLPMKPQRPSLVMQIRHMKAASQMASPLRAHFPLDWHDLLPPSI